MSDELTNQVDCNHVQDFESAVNTSSAIFIGEAVEERMEIVQTTHHGEGQSWDVKFKLVKSWMSGRRDDVWVQTSNKVLHCGEIEIGRSYLVYAVNTTNGLFIHPSSRTSKIGFDSAISDIKLLDTGMIQLNSEKSSDLNMILPFGVFLILIVVIIFARIRSKSTTKYESRN